MKKFLLGLLIVLVLAGIGAFVFKEPLMQAAMDSMTADMFVAADTDTFDPGIAIGASFPPIVAVSGGATVTDALQYSGPKGTVFVAVRSVDW